MLLQNTPQTIYIVLREFLNIKRLSHKLSTIKQNATPSRRLKSNLSLLLHAHLIVTGQGKRSRVNSRKEM